MSEQVVSVVNAFCDKFGMTVDWTSDNVKQTIQEMCDKYINYEIVTSILWCVVWIAITFVSLTFAIKFHRKAMAYDEPFDPYDDERAVTWVASILWVVFGFSVVIGTIVVFAQLFDIFTCLTFPEKMIAEYVEKLL